MSTGPAIAVRARKVIVATSAATISGYPGKPVLAGSSDAAFRGDASRHNPEDLLVAALSSCHMLSYLHLATTSKVVVTAYIDVAEGTMATEGDGGRFVEVVLRPR
jgi:organic hydroperoxide reductase OsmC/OhrA